MTHELKILPNERYCTECQHFNEVAYKGEQWFGAKCNKDGHSTTPSMYAIISLYEDCPYNSESEDKQMRMTSEKAIDIIDDNFTVIDTHGHFSDEEVEEARQMAIKALKQEPRWNSCSERLPAENTTVIGVTEFDDIYKAELYDDCGEKKWYADGNFDVPIVAWIPFPPSYTESEG